NNKINSTNNSFGQIFSTNGTSNFLNDLSRLSSNDSHQFRIEFEYTPDSVNFIQFIPSFNYGYDRSNISQQQNFNGFQNQDIKSEISTLNHKPSFESVLLYQHQFKKLRRNVSFQINLTRGNQNDIH